MLKFAIATTALFAFAAPVFAMDMTCDEASMTKMETEMGAMTDMAKKDTAMKELEMAKTAMKDSKADDCLMHMNNAAKSMM
jgi:hypothetical protein